MYISDILNHTEITVHLYGNICSKIDNHKNIIKYGFVDNFDTIYDDAFITICPTKYGSGTKIKINESISNNIPVLAHKDQANSSILEHCINGYVYDDLESFLNGMEFIRTKYINVVKNCKNTVKNARFAESVFEKTFFGNK